jgi:hypothetical protein
VAVPYAQTFLGLDREGANQTVREVFQQLVDAGRVALALPTTVERVLSKLEAGQLEIRVGEDGRNGTTTRRSRRTAATRQSTSVLVPLVVCLASLAAGVVLTLNQLMQPGWFCLGLGALAALSLLVRR